MLPLARLVSAGHGIDPVFARALPVAESFDPSRPAEGMPDCMRFADMVNLVEVVGENPLAWRYPAAVGLNRLGGAAGDPQTCIGGLPDQDFARGVLLPSYLETIASGQPVVHRIAAVVNNVLLSYSKMTVPLCASPRAGQASHLLMFVHVDFAIPLVCARGEGVSPLSFRERQCLSLAASGLMAKQVAAEIGVSEKTVELHLARARHKLGAHTTAQAIAISLAMAMMET